MNPENTNENSCRICLKTKVFFDWTEAIFEFSGPSYKECYYMYTHLEEYDEDVYTQMLCLDCGNGLRNTYQLVENALESDIKLKATKKYSLNPNTENIENDELDTSLPDVKILETQSDEEFLGDYKAIIDSDSKYKSDESNSSTSSNHNELQIYNAAEVKRRPLLCAYCSRIFYTRAHLTKHEKTHDINRERTEACPICGLKFYDKMALKGHIPVHDENRVRNYKCEFCSKAYFSRGGLNVHRRKHLGQIVKCKFCSKEYVRQLDLERHMSTHDIAPFTANIEISPKVQAKYFMECNTCGRKISRKYWRSHKAKHLHQPQLQCGLCNKTYYARKSICRHIKNCHDVGREEYAKVIITINQKFNPRHSSLMKKQNITIE